MRTRTRRTGTAYTFFFVVGLAVLGCPLDANQPPMMEDNRFAFFEAHGYLDDCDNFKQVENAFASLAPDCRSCATQECGGAEGLASAVEAFVPYTRCACDCAAGDEASLLECDKLRPSEAPDGVLAPLRACLKSKCEVQCSGVADDPRLVADIALGLGNTLAKAATCLQKGECFERADGAIVLAEPPDEAVELLEAEVATEAALLNQQLALQLAATPDQARIAAERVVALEKALADAREAADRAVADATSNFKQEQAALQRLVDNAVLEASNANRQREEFQTSAALAADVHARELQGKLREVEAAQAALVALKANVDELVDTARRDKEAWDSDRAVLISAQASDLAKASAAADQRLLEIQAAAVSDSDALRTRIELLSKKNEAAAESARRAQAEIDEERATFAANVSEKNVAVQEVEQLRLELTQLRLQNAESAAGSDQLKAQILAQQGRADKAEAALLLAEQAADASASACEATIGCVQADAGVAGDVISLAEHQSALLALRQALNAAYDEQLGSSSAATREIQALKDALAAQQSAADSELEAVKSQLDAARAAAAQQVEAAQQALATLTSTASATQLQLTEAQANIELLKLRVAEADLEKARIVQLQLEVASANAAAKKSEAAWQQDRQALVDANDAALRQQLEDAEKKSAELKAAAEAQVAVLTAQLAEERRLGSTKSDELAATLARIAAQQAELEKVAAEALSNGQALEESRLELARAREAQAKFAAENELLKQQVADAQRATSLAEINTQTELARASAADAEVTRLKTLALATSDEAKVLHEQQIAALNLQIKRVQEAEAVMRGELAAQTLGSQRSMAQLQEDNRQLEADRDEARTALATASATFAEERATLQKRIEEIAAEKRTGDDAQALQRAEIYQLTARIALITSEQAQLQANQVAVDALAQEARLSADAWKSKHELYEASTSIQLREASEQIARLKQVSATNDNKYQEAEAAFAREIASLKEDNSAQVLRLEKGDAQGRLDRAEIEALTARLETEGVEFGQARLEFDRTHAQSTEENQRLLAEAEQRTKELALVQATLAETEATVAAKVHDLGAVTARIAERDEQIASLNTKLSAAESELMRLREKEREVGEAFARQEIALQRARALVEANQVAAVAATSDLQQIANDRVAQLTRQMNDAQQVADARLEATRAEMAADNAALAAQLQEAQEETNVAKAAVSALEATGAATASELKAKTEALRVAQQRSDSLSLQVSELELVRKQLEQAQLTVQSEILRAATATARTADVEKQLAAADAKLAQNSADLQVAEKKVSEAQTAFESKFAAQDEHARKLSAEVARFGVQSALDLAKIAAASEALRLATSEYEQSLASEQATIAEFESKLLSVSADRDSALAEVAQLKAQLEARDRAAAALNAISPDIVRVAASESPAFVGAQLATEVASSVQGPIQSIGSIAIEDVLARLFADDPELEACLGGAIAPGKWLAKKSADISAYTEPGTEGTLYVRDATAELLFEKPATKTRIFAGAPVGTPKHRDCFRESPVVSADAKDVTETRYKPLSGDELRYSSAIATSDLTLDAFLAQLGLLGARSRVTTLASLEVKMQFIAGSNFFKQIPALTADVNIVEPPPVPAPPTDFAATLEPYVVAGEILPGDKLPSAQQLFVQLLSKLKTNPTEESAVYAAALGHVLKNSNPTWKVPTQPPISIDEALAFILTVYWAIPEGKREGKCLPSPVEYAVSGKFYPRFVKLLLDTVPSAIAQIGNDIPTDMREAVYCGYLNKIVEIATLPNGKKRFPQNTVCGSQVLHGAALEIDAGGPPLVELSNLANYPVFRRPPADANGNPTAGEIPSELAAIKTEFENRYKLISLDNIVMLARQNNLSSDFLASFADLGVTLMAQVVYPYVIRNLYMKKVAAKASARFFESPATADDFILTLPSPVGLNHARLFVRVVAIMSDDTQDLQGSPFSKKQAELYKIMVKPIGASAFHEEAGGGKSTAIKFFPLLYPDQAIEPCILHATTDPTVPEGYLPANLDELPSTRGPTVPLLHITASALRAWLDQTQDAGAPKISCSVILDEYDSPRYLGVRTLLLARNQAFVQMSATQNLSELEVEIAGRQVELDLQGANTDALNVIIAQDKEILANEAIKYRAQFERIHLQTATMGVGIPAPAVAEAVSIAQRWIAGNVFDRAKPKAILVQEPDFDGGATDVWTTFQTYLAGKLNGAPVAVLYKGPRGTVFNFRAQGASSPWEEFATQDLLDSKAAALQNKIVVFCLYKETRGQDYKMYSDRYVAAQVIEHSEIPSTSEVYQELKRNRQKKPLNDEDNADLFVDIALDASTRDNFLGAAAVLQKQLDVEGVYVKSVQEFSKALQLDMQERLNSSAFEAKTIAAYNKSVAVSNQAAKTEGRVNSLLRPFNDVLEFCLARTVGEADTDQTIYQASKDCVTNQVRQVLPPSFEEDSAFVKRVIAATWSGVPLTAPYQTAKTWLGCPMKTGKLATSTLSPADIVKLRQYMCGVGDTGKISQVPPVGKFREWIVENTNEHFKQELEQGAAVDKLLKRLRALEPPTLSRVTTYYKGQVELTRGPALQLLRSL